MQTYIGELNQYAAPRTPLTEHVRFGSSPVYGGHYFIVPLQKESSGEIDAALVYPIKSSDIVFIECEKEAYQLVYEKYAGRISPKYERETFEMKESFTNLYERIINFGRKLD